uniref:CARD domain-containing protein n=1 Tax=Neogobius melanostomus TaxID=47308 RepID=A0A8C6SU46_9GOBI
MKDLCVFVKVRPKHRNMRNVQVPAMCNFTVNQLYSVNCPGAHRVQPKKSTFILDYGPNYHPMFEIRLTAEVKLIHVKIRGETSSTVWEHEVDLTDVIMEELQTADTVASASRSFRELLSDSDSSLKQRLSSMRCEFIERVSEVVLDQVLDRLLQSGVLTGAERESAASIRERRTRAAQLIDSVLKKGSKASRLFIQNLHDQDLLLFDELLRI